MTTMFVYAPSNNTEEEVKDTFWRDLETVLEEVDPGLKLCMIDINDIRERKLGVSTT